MRSASPALRALPGAWALLAPVFLAGCEFNGTAIASPSSQVVVHAVLDPGFTEQMLLLERTLTGTVQLTGKGTFDFRNPVRTGGGIPISMASVTITSQTGARWVAKESPENSGVYLLQTGAGSELVPGHRYSLHVRTPTGEVVTGATTVPRADPRRETLSTEFDRDRDTLSLAWAAAEGARSYALRVDAPAGPFFFFTDSLSLRLPGTIRNLFVVGIPHVFIPGFRQLVTLSAVDANFFDYYRSRNDTFTGSGLISRLQGGIGLFGASVNLDLRAVDVVAAQDEVPEGNYLRSRGPGPARIQLWIETPASALTPAVVTGRYVVSEGSNPAGIIGTYSNSVLSLVLLRTQLLGDTAATLQARVYPDSLVGTVGNFAVAYLRSP